MPYLLNTWLFTLVVNGRDVIPVGNLDSATLIEDAGSILPTFECRFYITEPELLQYLNEGNKIQITIGRNFEECIRGAYRIHRVDQGFGGTGQINIYMNGIYDALPFLQNSKTAIYSQKNSSDVMKEIGSKYFKVESTYSSSDSMNWIQSGVPDKKFFNNVWIHSYSGNNTPIVGITADGRMRINTIKSAMSTPKYNFGTALYYYDPNYSISQNTVWSNSNGGYGKIRVQDDIESGFGSFSLADILPNGEGGRSTQIPRSSEVSPKMGQTKFTNENIHKHYWDAQSSNISNLMTLNNITLSFTYKNFWHPINVLDCIYFNDYKNLETNTVVSGKYLVTKVVRHIQNNQLMTLIQCARDNINDSKGDFLTSIMSGGLSDIASTLLGSAASGIGVIVSSATGDVSGIVSGIFNGQGGIITEQISGAINSVTSNLNLNSLIGSSSASLLSNITGMFSSSLSLGEYSNALSAITSAISSPLGMGQELLSQFPSISSLTDVVSQFLNFDSGNLLSNVFSLNLTDILGDGISSLVGNALSNIGGNALGSFGIDLGGIIGGMNLAYRSGADRVVSSMVNSLKNSVIDVG